MDRKNFLRTIINLSISTGLSSLLNPTAPIQINKICDYLNRKQQNEGFFAIDISNESSEGGEIRCFYDKSILRKIEVNQYWESGKIEKQIFFRLGQLLKAEENTYYYNVPVNINEEGAKELGTESFDLNKAEVRTVETYFKNGKISSVVQSNEDEQTKYYEQDSYYSDMIGKCQIVLDSFQQQAERDQIPIT